MHGGHELDRSGASGGDLGEGRSGEQGDEERSNETHAAGAVQLSDQFARAPIAARGAPVAAPSTSRIGRRGYVSTGAGYFFGGCIGAAVDGGIGGAFSSGCTIDMCVLANFHSLPRRTSTPDSRILRRTGSAPGGTFGMKV